MREVQINAYCDMCYHEHAKADQDTLPMRVPATQTITIGIGIGDGARPPAHVIDVCDVHAKPLAELAQFILDTPLVDKNEARKEIVAAPVPSDQIKMDYATCPVCQNKIVRSSIINHIWQAHRKDSRPTPPQGNCPDCGAYYERPQGLSQHRRHEHGYDALIDALSGVKGYKINGREREKL